MLRALQEQEDGGPVRRMRLMSLSPIVSAESHIGGLVFDGIFVLMHVSDSAPFCPAECIVTNRCVAHCYLLAPQVLNLGQGYGGQTEGRMLKRQGPSCLSSH